MLFSVLMAHYNNARFLEGALKSVYDQTYTNWEVIIVDDGSTDEFEQVISKYQIDPRIKVFKNERNMGTAYTKKLCVEKATGTIAGYLDPDDILDPNAISIMVEAHLQKPQCCIIHSTHYICNDKMTIIKIADYPKPLPENTPYLLVGDGSIHHFVSFKKSCYDKTEGLTATREYDRASDQELYYILEEEGDVFFINQPLHYYRIHPGGISNMGNQLATLKQHYTIIENECLRRLNKLQKSKQPDAAYWIKKYKTRYHKIRIIKNFRNKNWMPLLSSLFMFPFVGGMENIVSYFSKMPKEGLSLFRKSFSDNYKVVK